MTTHNKVLLLINDTIDVSKVEDEAVVLLY